MSINRVNTTVQEQNFTFLKNESSILHTTDTNKITINGVNVIVNKPKRGDLMFIRNNKVIWIDGLSITPEQLPQDYIPVGICLSVNGNKALVRYYKEELYSWAAVERTDISIDGGLYDGNVKTIYGSISSSNGSKSFTLHIPSDITTRSSFVRHLNEALKSINKNYSVELVERDTDKPAQDTSDGNVGSFPNRIVTNGINSITITDYSISKQRAIGWPVQAVKNYYLNNGFVKDWGGGCCRAKYIDYIKNNQSANAPTSEMTEINKVPGGISGGRIPVTLNTFETNANCTILRETFASYDEYIDSMMIKYPCGKGLAITKLSSGKENTYKLCDCTYLDNNSDSQKPLYPAAHWAASISFDIPGLGEGNWWLPSVAETVKIMRDITYGASAWDSNPDIINRVLDKLKNFGWSMINASTNYTTSSKYGPNFVWVYDSGSLGYGDFFNKNNTMAITIYEF